MTTVLILTTDQLTSTHIDDIISLKSCFWDFDYDSQIRWFRKYIRSVDEHLLTYYDDQLIGYCVLRNLDTYSILDTVIVHPKHRGQGLGKQIVSNICLHKTLPIFLLCEGKNVHFYHCNNFEICKNVSFQDKEVADNLIIMGRNHTSDLNMSIDYYG